MPEFKFSITVTEVSQQDVFIEAKTEEEAESILRYNEFDWEACVKFGEYLKDEYTIDRLVAIDGKPVKRPMQRS